MQLSGKQRAAAATVDRALTSAAHLVAVEGSAEIPTDYLERNRAVWEALAAQHLEAGRGAWKSDELHWGLWGTPESVLGLVTDFSQGDDAVELGCGTATISCGLARRGLRPVGIDISEAQIRNAERLQGEFKLRFPLVCTNAEQVAFDNESFDLAVSEYGVSLWCDPRRWLPEASRLLRPEGRLIFVTSSALLLACTPLDGGSVKDRLVRDSFSPYRVEFEHDGAVEFHVSHGHWIRLLRENGFTVEDLIEIRPAPRAKPRIDLVSLAWARRWPSEEIWVARKSS